MSEGWEGSLEGEAESLGGSQAALSVSVAAQSGLLSPSGHDTPPLPVPPWHPAWTALLHSCPPPAHLVLPPSHAWDGSTLKKNKKNKPVFRPPPSYRMYHLLKSQRDHVRFFNEDKLGYSGMTSFVGKLTHACSSGGFRVEVGYM